MREVVGNVVIATIPHLLADYRGKELTAGGIQKLVLAKCCHP